MIARTRTHRILTGLVASAVVASQLFCALAMADARKVVTLGVDLTEAQQASIMRFFGVSESEADVIYITNADEHAHLDGLIPIEQIGWHTYSCALVNPTNSGGIRVKTANLNYVTSNMIAMTLSTAGVSNCDVVAASPFEVSGTGALTGVIMAYETASGETLDEDKKELANEELVTTGTLAESVGQDEATLIVNDIKINLIREEVNVDQDVNIVVDTVINNTQIAMAERAEAAGQPAPAPLTDEERQMLYAYGQKIAQMEYEYDQMQETLERVSTNVAESAALEDPLAQTFVESQEPAALEEDSILLNTDDEALGEGVAIDATEAEALPEAEQAPAQEQADDAPFAITVSTEYEGDAAAQPQDAENPSVADQGKGDEQATETTDATQDGGATDPVPAENPGATDEPGTSDEGGSILDLIPFAPGSDDETTTAEGQEGEPATDAQDASDAAVEPGSDDAAEAAPAQDAPADGDAPSEGEPAGEDEPAAEPEDQADLPEPVQFAQGDGVTLTLVRTVDERSFAAGSQLLVHEGDDGAFGLVDLDGNEKLVAAYDDVAVYGENWAGGIVLRDGDETTYDTRGPRDDGYYLIDHVDIFYLPGSATTPVASLARDQFEGVTAEADLITVTDRATQQAATYDAQFNLVQVAVEDEPAAEGDGEDAFAELVEDAADAWMADAAEGEGDDGWFVLEGEQAGEPEAEVGTDVAEEAVPADLAAEELAPGEEEPAPEPEPEPQIVPPAGYEAAYADGKVAPVPGSQSLLWTVQLGDGTSLVVDREGTNLLDPHDVITASADGRYLLVSDNAAPGGYLYEVAYTA